MLLLLVAGQSSLIAQDEFNLGHWPDSLSKTRMRTTMAASAGVYTSGVSFLGFWWYRDHEREPFHFYNDNAGWLQMDKAAHAFFAYYESFYFYRALRWSGMKRKKAILYSVPAGILMQTPIEIFDGLYEGYGFSVGDMYANAAGPVLFGIQEWAFQDQVAKMKFSWQPSGYRQYRPGTLGETDFESFFLDYNAQTYWLSIHLQKTVPVKAIPGWLNLAVGYSGNWMLGEFDNPEQSRGVRLPDEERYRQWLFSLDVDLWKIKTRRKGLRAVFQQLNVLKVPFPTVEFNTKQGWRFHPVYW
ncbi:MAG: DUF2279 domain-containing protein [Salibacteraceae bacterium]